MKEQFKNVDFVIRESKWEKPPKLKNIGLMIAVIAFATGCVSLVTYLFLTIEPFLGRI